MLEPVSITEGTPELGWDRAVSARFVLPSNGRQRGFDNYAVLNRYATGGSGVSAAAKAVGREAADLLEIYEESQSQFGAKAEAISQLRMLAKECGEDDWDGNQACAIDERALETAEDFVRALPEDVPMPECAPEPDGAISLDWIQSRNRVFSISVGPSIRLAYAWLDGADTGHGVARFDGWSVPTRVLEGILSIVKPQDASFRII